MNKKKAIPLDEDELVTKGFFRQELRRELKSELKRELKPYVTKDFLKKELEKFATKDFLKQEINKSVSIILEELSNMRKENREMYLMREQLYKTVIDQEFQITDHEDRILKLEIAQ